MLWESSKMEQRYDAVLGVIRDGYTATEVEIPSGRETYSWVLIDDVDEACAPSHRFNDDAIVCSGTTSNVPPEVSRIPRSVPLTS